MSNLGQAIAEEAERETEERIIISMCDNDIAVEKIAVIANKTVEEVRAIIESK
jgi:hypothetical protein